VEHVSCHERKKKGHARFKTTDRILLAIVFALLGGFSFYILPSMVMKNAIRSWNAQRQGLAMLREQGLSANEAMRTMQQSELAKSASTALWQRAALLGMLV
jgi:hypothetical protein